MSDKHLHDYLTNTKVTNTTEDMVLRQAEIYLVSHTQDTAKQIQRMRHQRDLY